MDSNIHKDESLIHSPLSQKSPAISEASNRVTISHWSPSEMENIDEDFQGHNQHSHQKMDGMTVKSDRSAFSLQSILSDSSDSESNDCENYSNYERSVCTEATNFEGVRLTNFSNDFRRNSIVSRVITNSSFDTESITDDHPFAQAEMIAEFRTSNASKNKYKITIESDNEDLINFNQDQDLQNHDKESICGDKIDPAIEKLMDTVDIKLKLKGKEKSILSEPSTLSGTAKSKIRRLSMQLPEIKKNKQKFIRRMSIQSKLITERMDSIDLGDKRKSTSKSQKSLLGKFGFDDARSPPLNSTSGKSVTSGFTHRLSMKSVSLGLDSDLQSNLNNRFKTTHSYDDFEGFDEDASQEVLPEVDFSDTLIQSCAIHPYSNFRLFWDVITIIVLFINIIVIPVQIAFFREESTSSILFRAFSDFWFLMDMLMNFNTGIILDGVEGDILMDIKEVRIKYLSGWFSVDLLSSVPLDIILIALQHLISYVNYLTHTARSNHNLMSRSETNRLDLSDPLAGENFSQDQRVIFLAHMTPLLRLGKLFSLLKLLRVPRFFKYLMQLENILHFQFDHILIILKIVNQIGLLFLVAHLNACLQFGLGWAMHDLTEDCNMINKFGCFREKSWVHIRGLDKINVTVTEQYQWAIFRSTSQMFCIGYGLIMPRDTVDLVATMLGNLTGGVVFAVFIGQCTSWLENMDTTRTAYGVQMLELHEFMKFIKMPFNMRARVQMYYEQKYGGYMIDHNSIMKELNPNIRSSILSEAFKDILLKIPYLTDCENQFIDYLIGKCKFEYYLVGDAIVKEDAKATKLYLIQRGTVKKKRNDYIMTETLRDGSYFGEDSLIIRGCFSEATYWAHGNVACWSLHIKDFCYALEEHPLAAMQIQQYIADDEIDEKYRLRDSVMVDMKDAVFRNAKEFDVQERDEKLEEIYKEYDMNAQQRKSIRQLGSLGNETSTWDKLPLYNFSLEA